MRQIILFFLVAICPLAAEDKIAFVKSLNDLRTAENTVNEVIAEHNRQGFNLVDLTVVYFYQLDGSLQSNPIGKLKIPLAGDTHRWDGESSLDGSMKGSFNGKGFPSHFILKFHK